VVTEWSGAFKPNNIYGEGVFPLMFPDYVRCHDWGYERCFDWGRPTLDGLLIYAHILGDWYVHYGGAVHEQKKKGWAYRRMGVYARRYNEFFANATRRGLRDVGPPADSVRGFSHTMVEYTIDTFLARRGEFDSHFAAVRAALGSLGVRDGVGSAEWIDETIRREAIVVNSPDLRADVESFRSRITESNRPEEFAFRAGIKKFGLRSCEQSVEHLCEYIEIGLSEISAEDLSSTVESTAEFVGAWIQRATEGSRREFTWT